MRHAHIIPRPQTLIIPRPQTLRPRPRLRLRHRPRSSVRWGLGSCLALGLMMASLQVACGGRTAPSLWWTTANGNNANSNSNTNNGNANHSNTNNGNANTNSNTVIPPGCGNGVVEEGEQCDDGAANSDTRPDACRLNCRSPRCGDGVMDSWEGCDRQDFGGLDCLALGYTGGALYCAAGCELDPSHCTECGDENCDLTESPETCPEDCPPDCGDGWCAPHEDAWSCPADCGGVCGDGQCETGEDPYTCPEDCSVCGDGICGPMEDVWSCPTDCGYCGDGHCAPGEDSWTCPQDCSQCGDGQCTPPEDAWSCPQDCNLCGDGSCDPGEDAWTCPEDCGYCGDGYCGPYEDAQSCPADCGYCGDGYCGPYEDAQSCPADCGTAGTLSCQSVQMCTYCCAPSPGCEPACLQQASPTAQSEWSQLQACRHSACASECASGTTYDCYMCSYQHCPGICHYDASGSQGCATVVNCGSNCNLRPPGSPPGTCSGDPGLQCWDACWQQADSAAVVLYEALIGCIATHCGSQCSPDTPDPDCQTCQTTHCQYEMNACMQDT